MTSLLPQAYVGANDITFAPTWRRRWDSNPRAVARKLISSQPRYDHFDTSPFGFTFKSM